MTEDDTEELAREMFAQALEDGQSARRMPDDTDAERVRAALRTLGRAANVRLRTARMDDAVVVARLDAAIWTDDTATMRAKLTPPTTERRLEAPSRVAKQPEIDAREAAAHGPYPL